MVIAAFVRGGWEGIGRRLGKQTAAAELWIVLLVTVAVTAYWSVTISAAPCGGLSDCVKYTAMTEGFRSGEFGPIDYPFNLRILGPWLASQITGDAVDAFRWINGISTVLFVAFWFGIARTLGLRNIEFVALLSWFFLHPLGFRFYHSIPVSVDPLAYMLLALVVLLYVRRIRWLLWPAVFVSMLAKESFAFVALIILIAEGADGLIHRGSRGKMVVTSMVAGIAVLMVYETAKWAMNIHVFPQTQSFKINSLLVVAWWARETWNDPNRLIVWVGSILCATGVFGVLALNRWSWSAMATHIREFVFFGSGACGFLAFGLLAGSDMSRIIFNGNLLVLAFVFILARQCGTSVSAIAWIVAISTGIACSYTLFFPSAFEYEYYNTRSVSRIGYFILAGGLLLIAAYFVLRRSRPVVPNGGSVRSSF